MDKRFLAIIIVFALTFISVFDAEAKSKPVSTMLMDSLSTENLLYKEVSQQVKSLQRKKVLHAYNRYLSANKQKWGYSKVVMSECEFALKDFDNDGIPELILLWPNASTSSCFERVYAYKKGAVKELFQLYSGGIDGIYPTKGICVVTGIHTGGCWENIYKISKGKCKCILSRSGSDYVKGHEGDFYYNQFYKGKKKITKSKFHRLKKKLIGNSKNKKTYKYRKNTKKNRKSILM